MSDSMVHRYVLETRNLPDLETTNRTVAGYRALVLGDGADADTIASQLDAAGAEVRRTGDPLHEPIDLIVDCNLSDAAPWDWRTPLRHTLSTLQTCYDHWSSETNSRRLFYVAVTRLGGELGAGQMTAEKPLGGLWAGLAKTLPREFPNCNIRVVDLAETTQDVGNLIIEEVLSGQHFEVGYSRGQRRTLLPVAEPNPVMETTLGPTDTILVTGGGRGIGWAFATYVAETFGCRVVVSGRAKPPTDADLLDDEQLGSLLQRSLSNSAGEPTHIRQARKDDTARRSASTLGHNLAEAADRGLSIEYVQCDVRTKSDVSTLFKRAGRDLTHVVHNAGIDQPIRLDKKNPDDSLNLVSVKIDGFLNVLDEAQNYSVVSLTVSGSLTGRFGGMVGQIDYAAANDGLARLCMWADKNHDTVVKCLAWPTWVHTGLVSNYDAAIKYMAAIEPVDGARRWSHELMNQSGGEILFAGPIGPALVPSQLLGTPISSDLPDSTDLVRARALTGRPLKYLPGDIYEAEVDLPAEGRDLVGTIVELCLQSADWTKPFEAMIQQIDRIEDLYLDAPRLLHEPGRLRCVVNASGVWTDERQWSARVSVEVNGVKAVSADVFYSSTPPILTSSQSPPHSFDQRTCRIVGQTVWYSELSDHEAVWSHPVLGTPLSRRIPIEHISAACAFLTAKESQRWSVSFVTFGADLLKPARSVRLRQEPKTGITVKDTEGNILVDLADIKVIEGSSGSVSIPNEIAIEKVAAR